MPKMRENGTFRALGYELEAAEATNEPRERSGIIGVTNQT
jgi:hypothetical protein